MRSQSRLREHKRALSHMTDQSNPVERAKTLWAGRYETQAAESLRKLNDSYPFDKRLFMSDIACSIAYANALHNIGLLTRAELTALEHGLEQVEGEFRAGTFQVAQGDEDIHTAVERRLGEIVGAAAGKLHTGRSRNDQVATDTRHWLADTITL